MSELGLGRVLGGRAGRRAAPRPAGRASPPRASCSVSAAARSTSGSKASMASGRVQRRRRLGHRRCARSVSSPAPRAARWWGCCSPCSCCVRRADQVVVGFALSLGGVGLATFLYRHRLRQPAVDRPVRRVAGAGIGSDPAARSGAVPPAGDRVAVPAVTRGDGLGAEARRAAGLELRAAGDGRRRPPPAAST